MVVLALIILGLTARSQMPAELTPKIDLPFITIVTVYPGAGPQEIETLVSEPIEEAVGSAANLKNITSSSQDGVSAVFMEFELGTNIDTAAADVRDKLSAARSSLPRDIEEPVITKADITAQPIMTLALRGPTGPNSSRDLRILADRTIKDQVAKVKGVAAVYVSGGDVREISVSIDRDRLQAYGLSIDEVAQALQAANLNLPSGSIKEGAGGLATRDYAVRTVGEFKNAEEIANIRLKLPGDGGTARLGDIADVRDTVEEPSTLTRLNGQPSVILAVQKQSDANTVQVADGVSEEINRLNGYTPVRKALGLFPLKTQPVKGTLAAGVKLLVTTDSSQFVREALRDVYSALIEGVILVILIVFLFLHSIRATFIVALAIPTSIIATFLPMRFFGFSMNMMTMLALALSVGILVDDSIVVLENIERHLRKGEPPKVAALNGRSEIGLAAITITLVDVVVFVPIAFMGGIVGQFFRQFGLTVATATLFSLFMSFTLTPMLASRWLKSKEEEDAEAERAGQTATGRMFGRFDAFYSALDGRYRGLLAWAIGHRALTIVIGVVSLLTVMVMPGMIPMAARLLVAALGIGLVLLGARGRADSRGVALGFAAIVVLLMLFIRFPVGVGFMPDVDNGEFSVSIELPAGSGLDATDRVTRQVEGVLSGVQGMEYYQSTAGASSTASVVGAGSRGPQYARASVKLLDHGPERPTPIKDVVAAVNQKTALIPGAQITVATQSMAGHGGQPIQMEIAGQDMDQLVSVARAIEAKMKKVPGAIDVRNSWEVGKPELRVTVDRQRAADMGVRVADIASALRTSIQGNTDSKLRDRGDEYDIRVHLARVDRRSTSDVPNVIVGHRDGTPIYLRDVARVDLSAAPNQIDRKNRQRLVTVGANIGVDANLGNVQSAVNKALKDVPTGTATVSVGGSSQMSGESFGYLFSALFLAIAMVYMLMGALFESFATPFIIMFSLPQAMIGALLALMVTGKAIDIVSMIGIIMLIGLVTKNAILLVDYTNTLRGRGLARNDAILEAGPTRLRPIMMTTLAMIGGMLPTALAVSRGAELRQPMAIVVIGGLMFSAFLTLLVIPAFYTIVDDWVGGLGRRLGLGRSRRPEQTP